MPSRSRAVFLAPSGLEGWLSSRPRPRSQPTTAFRRASKSATRLPAAGALPRHAFQEMETGRASGGDARALAEQFIEALLRDALGFASVARTAPRTIGDRVYPVRFFALGDRVPIVVAPAGAGLDAPLPDLGHDQRRRSAFGLLQEVLNASRCGAVGPRVGRALATDRARQRESHAAGVDRSRPEQDLHGGSVPRLRRALAPRPRVSVRPR